MAQKKIVQTAGRDQLGEFAPEFARLNDDVLFGEVWSRNDLLSLRDRSLVTITSLVSQGMTDSSLTYHLQTAKANGITRTEISEIITHIAFYAGWPKAWAAFRQAKDVWAEDETAVDARAAFQKEMIFLSESLIRRMHRISRDAVTSPVFQIHRFPFLMSLLNPGAAITGISIGLQKEEDRCSWGSPDEDGIKKKANLLRRYFRARSSTFRLM